jgi:hypothetical protein
MAARSRIRHTSIVERAGLGALMGA